MIEFGQVLTGLVQRTEEGRLKWSRGVQENRFVTSVDTISLAVSFSHEVRGSGPYFLDIYNESGEPVESFGYPDATKEQSDKLARLYVLARRSALNLELTLEKIAKALELQVTTTTET